MIESIGLQNLSAVSSDKSTLVVILDNLYHQVYCILYNLLKCHKKSIKVAINASFCISVAIKQFSLELKRFLSQEVNIQRIVMLAGN